MPKTSFSESKLFKIWRLLEGSEAVQLKKWLLSPWVNTPAHLIDLHNILCKYYPHFRAKGLTRSAVFQQLFPQRKLDTKLLATLMSLLTRKMEEFLLHNHLRQDEELQQQLLIQVLHNRGKRDWVRDRTSKRIDLLLANGANTWEDTLWLSRLHEKRYRLSTSRDKALQAGEADLLEANHFNDLAYKWRKYRYLLELSEREKILGVDYRIEKQLALLPAAGDAHIPALQLYRTFIDNRNKYGISHFAALKQLWLEQHQFINQQDQSILLFYLINIGARIHLQGGRSILSQLLDLYKIGVKEHLLLEGNQMTTRTFANIVTTANLVGDFDFVRLLLEQHSHSLPEPIQQDAITWAKTHLAFNSKDPKLWESSSQLQQIGSIKNTFSIRTRVLLMQMWFEDYFSGKEKDGNFMLYFCEAFSLQLKRSKLYSPERLAALRAFIKYSRTLIRLKMRNRLHTNKLEEIRAAVEAVPRMPARAWLMQQLDKITGE